MLLQDFPRPLNGPGRMEWLRMETCWLSAGDGEREWREDVNEGQGIPLLGSALPSRDCVSLGESLPLCGP